MGRPGIAIDTRSVYNNIDFNRVVCVEVQDLQSWNKTAF